VLCTSVGRALELLLLALELVTIELIGVRERLEAVRVPAFKVLLGYVLLLHLC
jgi:hypothetical protein